MMKRARAAGLLLRVGQLQQLRRQQQVQQQLPWQLQLALAPLLQLAAARLQPVAQQQ